MAIIRGTSENDSLSGQPDNDLIFGFAGDDTIDGGSGDDLLVGGDDDDNLIGGGGVDTLNAGAGADSLTGENGDNLDGGHGDDLLVVGGSEDEPTLKASGGADDDTFVSINADRLPAELDLNFGLSLSGNSGNDKFVFTFGLLQASLLDGGCGNDNFAIRYVLGGVLIGGSGHDQFNIRNMRGTVLAGDGNDIISVGANQAGETLLMGDAGDDIISALAGSAVMEGGEGNDLISDSLDPLGSPSTLIGGSGDDTLISQGQDILSGGDDSDNLESGAFSNTLTGGAGADRFSYGDLVNLDSIVADTITDFNVSAGDVLDVSRLLDRVGAPTDPFAAGWLTLEVSSDSTLVLFDRDGGGDNFQVISKLEGSRLTEADIDVECTPLPTVLGRYYVVDADTNHTLMELTSGSVLNPALFANHNLSIYAVVNTFAPAVTLTESIQLDLNSGAVTRSENVEPFSLFGDLDGDFRGGLLLEEGQHNIRFDFYSTGDAQGELLGSETVRFAVGWDAEPLFL